MLPFKSIDHYNGNPSFNGASKDLETVSKAFTMVVEFSFATGGSAPTGGTVTLQGSLDRVAWIDLASVTPSDGSVVPVTVDGPHYFRYVRAIQTLIAGGAYEQVTATIAPVVVVE